MNRDHFVIRHSNGMYFRGWSGVGPMFAARLVDAELFDNLVVAFDTIKKDPSLSDCEVVYHREAEKRDRHGS